MFSSYLFGVLFRAPAIILATAVMGSISLCFAPFDTNGERQLRVARAWARILLWCAGARVKVVGAEKLDLNTPYVLCPNHVSYYDTPVLLSYLPPSFRFLAKKELFDIPLLGGHLGRAGNISVPLEDPRASLKVLTEAGRAMQANRLSLLIFPEGGRSETGELSEFRDGASYLAIKGQVPIVPIAIVGVGKILPIHSHHVRPGSVTLRIGDPIPTAGLKPSDRTALTQQLYDTIAAMQKQGL